MNEYFKIHNHHLSGLDDFIEKDPQLSKLSKLKYVYQPNELDEFLNLIPGIFTLSGGRQIGKTTLLKQWMLKLIQNNIPAKHILYLTGELIATHLDLVKHLKTYIDEHESNVRLYIICDEITDISNWDKAVKFLADAGLLSTVTLMLSGSDSSIIKEARNRFPGRRGEADKLNFHFSPLSFKETVILKYGNDFENAPIENLFNEFLIHGGFLTAINKYAQDKTISNATYLTYSEWIIGDMVKRGKQEAYLIEIFQGIIKRIGTQITWNSLAKDMSIEHHKTISDYVHLLSDLDVVFIQSALMENKLVAAPKKAKKLFFKDPFIFHALCSFINQDVSCFESSKSRLMEMDTLSILVEQTAIMFIQRKYPQKTFYIKAEGEVDIAYVEKGSFVPIEVKWTNQLRSKDLKQVRKYSNGQVWGKFEDQNSLPPVKSLLKELLV